MVTVPDIITKEDVQNGTDIHVDLNLWYIVRL